MGTRRIGGDENRLNIEGHGGKGGREMKWKMVSSLALKHEFELESDNLVRLELICEKPDIADQMKAIFGCNTARTIDEWHEDYGDVLWWTFPIEEPPYCGSPLDADWPDYHTHWTPIIIPDNPNR